MQKELAAQAAARAGGGGFDFSGLPLGDVPANDMTGADAARLLGGNVQISEPEQSAFDDVRQRMQQASSAQELISDFKATLDSANRGNVRDRFKLDFYANLADQYVPAISQQLKNRFSQLIQQSQRGSNTRTQISRRGNNPTVLTTGTF